MFNFCGFVVNQTLPCSCLDRVLFHLPKLYLIELEAPKGSVRSVWCPNIYLERLVTEVTEMEHG
jgi:hypothetical protein